MVPLIWSLREAGGARVGGRSAIIILAGASRATRHLPAISSPASGTPGIHRTREARERRGSLVIWIASLGSHRGPDSEPRTVSQATPRTPRAPSWHPYPQTGTPGRRSGGLQNLGEGRPDQLRPMTEQRPAGAGLQSPASLRRLIPLALVVGSVLLPLPCRPSARARKVRGPKAAARQAVPNYGVVWENRLTRSGQPRSEEGWRWLRRQGVKSVVNFRAEEDTDYTGLDFERVLWLPFTSHKPPTDDDAEEFLAF